MFFFLGPYVEDKNEDSSMSMYAQDEEWNEWEVGEINKRAKMNDMLKKQTQWGMN